jgi:hypothetical protein
VDEVVFAFAFKYLLLLNTSVRIRRPRLAINTFFSHCLSLFFPTFLSQKFLPVIPPSASFHHRAQGRERERDSSLALQREQAQLARLAAQYERELTAARRAAASAQVSNSQRLGRKTKEKTMSKIMICYRPVVHHGSNSFGFGDKEIMNHIVAQRLYTICTFHRLDSF